MDKFGTEFKVGLFTLLATVAIGYMFFVLSPGAFDSDEKVIYYSYLDDAAGIIPKTHVKTNGVTIGSVKEVRLKNNNTLITLEVRKDIKIPVGSKLEIRTRGLLGDVFIEIMRTNDEGKYVEAEGLLPLSNDQVNMQQLVSIFGSIAKDIKVMTNSLSSVIGGEEGKRTISQIVNDIEQITSGTREIIQDNKSNIKELIANLQSTTATLDKVLGKKEADLEAIIANVKTTTEDLRLFAKDIKGIVGGPNRERIDQILSSFDTTMGDVEKTAKNVRLVSEKIERGEGTLGRLINDENAIAELEGAIKDIRDVLKPATKTQINVDYHGEFVKSGETKHYFNLTFRTRPDKYYLLGLIDHKDRIITRTEKEISNDSDGVKTVETINEKKALRFNAQIAKRFNLLQVRAGLFESTGGIGFDFFAWNDRLKLSLEAFDFDSSTTIRRTAHFKSYFSILFFDHVYAMVGIDDPTETDENGVVDKSKNHMFIGAGLSFNDDDLKAIFGTAALAL